MKLLTTLIAACVAIATLPAFADGEVQKIMTAADKKKLADYGSIRKQAISEARKGASTDVAALDRILAKPLQDFAGLDLTGAWQCRTTKLGGLGPLVIYGWFRCKVTDDGSGWKLDKISGSQRTTGRFYDDGAKRMIYLGTYYSSYDKPKPYGNGPKTDQVGYAFRTGQAEWRIEFPAPAFESKLDIIEFKR